jgi:hypothetical protein
MVDITIWYRPGAKYGAVRLCASAEELAVDIIPGTREVDT